MKTRDRYLTGFLLILIGVLIGTILTIYQQGGWVSDQANVKVTEIKHSDKPIFSDKDLEGLDARFLFKAVARKVTPTVVYIETVVPLDDIRKPDDEYHNQEEEEGLWDRFLQRRARTVGSGVLVTEQGYILTNNHVIDGAVKGGIRVVLNDKRMFKARTVGTDPTTDLAVLKIDAENLPSVVVGNSDEVNVGEWVLAIGNPFRLRSTVTAGIVSALSRDVQIINDQMRVESFIQTDAAINKGNSGGALVNTSGELIGINTAIASQSGSYQGYGFAVPSNLASKVAHDIIEFGEVRRALLGVSILSVDATRAEELGMSSIRGVEIMSSNGAAAEYGLARHDVILSVNGEEVYESNELQEKIAVLHPGETVQLEIWREGTILNKAVKLGMLEEAEPELSSNRQRIKPENNENGNGNGDEDGPNNDRERGVEFGVFDLGFKVMALSKPEDAEQFDLIITEVDEDSEAGRRGLKKGYVIKEINDQKAEDLKALKNLIRSNLRKNGSILMQIETKDGVKGYYELNQ